MNLPDNKGYFGEYGGRYVPETLMPALTELDLAYREVKKDPAFRREYGYYLREFAGRPTKLYLAQRLSNHLGLKLYLKREDLLHTGAHKINNTLGQALLAKRMGKKRIIAETGAGQHGVATAAVCALFGLECEIYMGEEDMRRQRLNVLRMRLFGAKVSCVRSGSRTLKDATNEAMRDWVATAGRTHYIIGSVVGPHPFPMMVRDFQVVIGQEVRRQIRNQEGRLPDFLIACVGGGSNSIGLFYPFLKDRKVSLFGVEAAGEGLSTSRHAATLVRGRTGVLHGSKSFLLQNFDGQINIAHSVSAGLDYPGVGPEHAHLKQISRARYYSVTDGEALKAVKLLSELEGIIPALESAHALAYLMKKNRDIKKKSMGVLCLSGRGDKDMDIISEYMPLSQSQQGGR